VSVEPGPVPDRQCPSADAPIVFAVGLPEVLSRVADPRRRQGRRYTLVSILLIALAATAAGAQTFAAIGEWAADAPAAVLARLGIGRAAPSEKTIRRLLQRLDGDGLDTLLGAWTWLRAKTIGGVTVISFDGKTLRGARDATGRLTHLLAGICQTTGLIVAQKAVDGKTSEVPVLRELLATLDITGCVITADAAHTCRETAQAIIDAGGGFVLTVKGNQPLLRKLCKALPWNDVPVLDRRSGPRRHGRLETRTLQATEVGTATGIGFPGAVQVLRIHRTRTMASRHRGTRRQTRETVYVVTSLSIADASHQQIAEWLQAHWKIENSVHHVRDTTFDEDRHQNRTGSGPQVLAAVRNTVINLLRLTGHDSIAAARRYHARDFDRPVKLLLNS
jgi:predicted transposase YbfD/YdcC